MKSIFPREACNGSRNAAPHIMLFPDPPMVCLKDQVYLPFDQKKKLMSFACREHRVTAAATYTVVSNVSCAISKRHLFMLSDCFYSLGFVSVLLFLNFFPPHRYHSNRKILQISTKPSMDFNYISERDNFLPDLWHAKPSNKESLSSN